MRFETIMHVINVMIKALVRVAGIPLNLVIWINGVVQTVLAILRMNQLLNGEEHVIMEVM